MAKILYVRVSSTEQNLARQETDTAGYNKVFHDKCSGKDTNRPGLAACLDYLREGDVLTVYSIDRLARSLTDLQRLVDGLTAKGIDVVFLKKNLTFSADTSNAMNRLTFQIMGAFAEFERNLIHERQAEGIAQAKKAGRYKGGKTKLSGVQAADVRSRHAAGENVASIARAYGITRQTVYAYLAKE